MSLFSRRDVWGITKQPKLINIFKNCLLGLVVHLKPVFLGHKKVEALLPIAEGFWPGCAASCSCIQLLPPASFPSELVLTSCQSHLVCSRVGGMRSFSSCSAHRLVLGRWFCGVPQAGLLRQQKPWWQRGPRAQHPLPRSVNEHLLRPLRLEMDPNLQSMKYQEKEQIKILNNKFAFFIDKFLEQQNKVLETKQGFLQEQKCYRSNTEPMFETYIGNLKRQLHVLGRNRAKLETERGTMQGIMEDYKKKKPTGKRAENEFDTDCAYVNKVELEAKVESLVQEINSLRSLYKVVTLQAFVSDTSFIVQMDNSWSLDMDDIIADVKAQHDNIGNGLMQSPGTTYEELRETTSKHDDSLHNTKNQIVELNWVIQRLTGECENTKVQRYKLEGAIAEELGAVAGEDAKCRLSELEASLQPAKQDTACEYQELTNVKLALDIEMATYRKLQDGGESRWVYSSSSRCLFRSRGLVTGEGVCGKSIAGSGDIRAPCTTTGISAGSGKSSNVKLVSSTTSYMSKY
uniref:Keratin 84 n=1 Tax=Bubo bubo TaxID=30461 RepID=A0A8C0EPR9_BUBBB